MQLIHFLGLGIFLLILAYLGSKNAGGVAQIFNSGGTVLIGETKTLQGR